MPASRTAHALRARLMALDRLLDPENLSLTLGSLAKVAAALGKRVHVELVDQAPGCVARRRAKRRHA